MASSNLFLLLAWRLLQQMQMQQHTPNDATVKPTRTGCVMMGPIELMTSMMGPIVLV